MESIEALAQTRHLVIKPALAEVDHVLRDVDLLRLGKQAVQVALLVVYLQGHGAFFVVLLGVEELRGQLDVNGDVIECSKHFSVVVSTRHRFHLELLANSCHGLARVDDVEELLDGVLELSQSEVALQLV